MRTAYAPDPAPVAESLRVPPTPITITLRARDTAFAWLNAFLAAGADPDRPTLYRALSVEVFAGTGVQFIATNGHVLFRTWVPAVLPEDTDVRAPFPELEEAPDCTVLVRDADGFARSFLKALLSACTGADEHAPLTLSLEEVQDEAEPALGGALARWGVSLTSLKQTLHVPLYEADYPNWRAIEFGASESSEIDGVLIGRQMFSIVGRLRAVSKVLCTFTGVNRAIAIHATGELEVRGLLMPMRQEPEAE